MAGKRLEALRWSLGHHEACSRKVRRVEFRVLGPLEVSGQEGPLSLGGRQRQLVLAVLLAQAGQVVSTDRLIDEIWGASPPRAARKTVQSYAAELRKLLNRDREVLSGQGAGYVLEVEPDQVDAQRFETHLQDARDRLGSDPLRAARALREALGMWRGPAYGDLADDAPSLQAEAARLEELRLGALEARIEADLRAGEDKSLVPELERAVAAHPYRERLRALLMLALYRASRQADALAAYREARRALAEELGLEPSRELRRLEQAVLEQHPLLDSADPLGALAAPEEPGPARNPYKGLRPFGEDDASDFFGRADLVRRLTERLGRRDMTGRLVVVAGPSGSGKSSVLRAGLIPALRRGEVDGSESWGMAVLYPGDDPLAALRKALGDLGVEGDEDEDPASLLGSLEESTLLLVDQFEELFTLCDAPEVRRTFLDALTTTVAEGTSPVRVVIAVRADFLDQLLKHPQTAEVLQDSLQLVGPLEEHEVRAAITEPARRTGVVVDPDLVAAMGGDAVTRPGALPLLQYALTDLFERRAGDRITLEAYRAAGGISGALARRADQLYGRLAEPEQEAARQLLLRLVTLTEEGEPLRRRLTREELATLPFDEEVLDRILEVFTEHRLLTAKGAPGSAATVEVAHEALLSEWGRLRGWIEAAREDLRQHRRLAQAVRNWLEGGRDPSDLLRGSRLEQTEAWSETARLALSDAELDFLQESRRREDARHRQRIRRRRMAVGVLSVVTVVAVGLAAVAVDQRAQATDQARLARARELAALSANVLGDDPQLGILLGLEAADAYRSAGLPLGRDVLEALHHAVLASRVRGQFPHHHEDPVGVAYSPDGRYLAAGGGDGIVRVLDAETGEQVALLEGHLGQAVDVKWSPDGAFLASTGQSDGWVRLWDVPAGTERAKIAPGGGPLIVSVAPDGEHLAVTGSTFTGWYVAVWDLGEGVEVWRREDLGFPVAVEFEPVRGDRVAITNWTPEQRGGGLVVADASTGEDLMRIPSAFGECELRWSPDGTRIASAGPGGAVIWDASSGEELVRFHGHHSLVCTVDFTADGSLVATGGEDGFARIWSAATGEEVLALGGHTERVGWVSLSPDGRRLATTSNDGYVKTWDVGVTGRQEVLAVEDPGMVTRGQYGADGTRLVIASTSSLARLLDARTGEEVTRFPHERPVYDLDLSPDGSRVLTGSQDGTARVWDAATGEELARVALGSPSSVLPVVAVVWNPDGELAAVGTSDSTHLWRPSEDRVLDLEDPPSDLASLAFSPDGTQLAGGFGGADVGGIRIWDGRDGTILSDLSAGVPFTEPSSLRFTSDGSGLLAAHTDGLVRLWDLSTGEVRRELAGHSGRVVDAASSPDGAMVASAGVDGTVRLWEATTGKLLLVLRDDPGPTSVSFSEDGAHLMVTGSSGVHVYLTDPEEVVELARSRLVRWWTPEECFQFLEDGRCPPPPERLRVEPEVVASLSVVLDTEGCRIERPVAIPEGMVSVKVENRTDGSAVFVMVAIQPGYTVQDHLDFWEAQDAKAETGEPPADPRPMEAPLGFRDLGSGRQDEFTAHLRAGPHLFHCITFGPEGPERQLSAPLEVSE